MESKKYGQGSNLINEDSETPRVYPYLNESVNNTGANNKNQQNKDYEE